jgi:hypothetical protein
MSIGKRPSVKQDELVAFTHQIKGRHTWTNGGKVLEKGAETKLMVLGDLMIRVHELEDVVAYGAMLQYCFRLLL